jgi:hypothetical protein
MRVLIYTPTYRLEPQTVNAALGLQRAWADQGYACDWMIERDNPFPRENDPRAFRNIHHSYTKLTKIVRGTDLYDAVLILESDIVPPADALTEMHACMKETGADVVYAPYVFRGYSIEEKRIMKAHGRRPHYRVNIATRLTPKAGDCRNTGDLLDSDVSGMLREKRHAYASRFYPCSGAGLGCVLVKTDVLRQVPFTLNQPGHEGLGGLHCDAYWNDAVWRAGYEQYGAMRVICGHVDEDGEILYPSLP